MMDKNLTANLDLMKKAVLQDWDCMVVVDGLEGSGKSLMALQSAAYCDPGFNLSRVVFTPDELVKAVSESNKFEAIVFDEAFSGLYSRDAMSKANRVLIKMFAEIRQKNLIIFVVMPSYFELERYVALHRSRALINVMSRAFKRGGFGFYNQGRAKTLYLKGKKTLNHGVVKPNFYGNFGKEWPLAECVGEYKDKKLESLQRFHEHKDPDSKFKLQRDKLINLLIKYLRDKDIAAEIGMSDRQVRNVLAEGRKELEVVI